MPRAFPPLVCLAAVLGAGAPAAAKGLPPLASEQDPPRFIDETEVKFVLLDRIPGYWFSVSTTLYGPVSASDAVRIDFTQKGKVLASQRCPLDGPGKSAGIDCDYKGKPLKAVGQVTANLILIDDQAEKEYLLRQFNLTVAVFPWMKEKHYQILHDDMLGTAFVWHQPETRLSGGSAQGQHELKFYFWTAGSLSEKPQLRCTVDGKKIPDIQTWLDTATGGVDVDAFLGGKQVTYRWGPEIMTPERLLWGSFDEIREARNWGNWDHEKAVSESYRFLEDMPGDWSCNLRLQSKVIRTFAFKVNAKGMIEPSAAQKAPGFPMLVEGAVHVDMRLPARNDFDDRVRPDAIRKSMGYGLPWPKHPAVEAFKKSLPPASGLPDPGKK